MNDYLTVLLFAAMPAAGNVAGGLLAEMLPFSRRGLSLSLHLAAGVVLAVIGIELMGEALGAEPPWAPVLGLLAGGGFAALLDRSVDFIRSRMGDTKSSAGAWMIFIGVAVDLFSDGVMIGTGSTISLGLGLLLALGQVPADIPEGFATIATFKDKGLPRPRRMLLSLSFALPVLLGATVGYWGVRGLPEIYKFMLLAFTAGILLTVAVEEIVGEAHEAAVGSRGGARVLVAGYALFALISVSFE